MANITNVVVFYFSGTGNAKRIALWLSEFAAQKNIDCHLYNIAKTDKASIPSFTADTLLIIISPIHGFNYPKITLDFIQHFPKGTNRVVLMNTRAGMKIGNWVTPGLTGIAFMFSSFILKAKGYSIVGQIPFDMPSNWISLHPALNENTVKFLHQKNYDRVEQHANRIFSGESDFLAYRDIVQDVLIAPISLGYYLIGRFAIAKTFYANSDCDNCGICIKQCPVNAIKMVDGRPFWTFKCESCMKCMNHCPLNAIETAHGLFTITSFCYATLTTFLLHHILKINIQSEFIREVIYSIAFLGFLWAFYHLQHRLLRYKWAEKLITYTSLTHYKFWGRYQSIVNSKWRK